MKDNDIYEQFEEILKLSEELSKKIIKVNDELSNVLVRNAELEIENENLREKLNDLTDGNDVSELSKSRLNLVKIYEKGYHVCAPMYGSHRDNDEECAFCLEVIYGHQEKKG